MKRETCLQLFVLTTILVATMASTDIPLPLLPTLAIDPTKSAYPETTPKAQEAPNCPNLTLNYDDYYKVEQKEGDVLFPLEKTPPMATTSGEDLESTTNSTSTEATTSTTIDATTTSTNSTMPMKEACVVPTADIGKQYNWWQILLDNGGKPGTLNGTAGPGKDKEMPLGEPCVRPLQHDKNYITYSYKNSDLKTYARFEDTYSRFKGTPSYFEDVRGRLVWTPPERTNDRKVYSVLYTLDDTGFWVYVESDKCRIKDNTLLCFPLPYCSCESGQFQCQYPIAVPQNLLIALIG